jgi:hypothetical protein
MDKCILPRFCANADLTETEKRLIACAETGKKWTPQIDVPVDWRELPLDDESHWPSECKLDANFIRGLLISAPWTEDGAPLPISPKGLWIENAYIADTLDLQGCKVVASLWMKNCAFAKGIRLRDAETRTIGFNGSIVGKTPPSHDFDPHSIDAVRIRVRGKLYLAKGFIAQGEVNLASAHIGGQMECTSGRFNGSEEDLARNKDLVALRCDGIEVDDSVLLADNFHASATVNFEGARVNGSFICSGGLFENAGGTALNCGAIRVGVDVKLNLCHRRTSPTDETTKAFRATGMVDLSDAKIEGQLDCDRGEFRCTDVRGTGSNAIALHADNITVSGNADLSGINTTGIVRFRGAHIGGYFSCSYGCFETILARDADGRQLFALQCSGITVGDRISINHIRVGTGGADFSRAAVSGAFYCREANFNFPGEPPYDPEFAALRLSNARIKTSLYFQNIDEFKGCLNLEHAEVSVIHDDGSLWLPSALCSKNHTSEISYSPETQREANTHRRIYGKIRHLLTKQKRKEKKNKDREHPVGTCVIKLDGFTYQRFIHPQLGEERCSDLLIAWLKCQPRRCKSEDFKPQPWQQLIRVMRTMGHKEFSKRIAIAYHDLDLVRPYGNTLGLRIWRRWRIIFGAVFRALVGYGYRPLWALRAALVFLAIGWAVFAAAGNLGFMAPREDAMVAHYAEQEHPKSTEPMQQSKNSPPPQTAQAPSPLPAEPVADLPAYYPHFNAFTYAVDVFIPMLDLGQESAWEPSLEQRGHNRSDGASLLGVHTWLGQETVWGGANSVCRTKPCGGLFGVTWLLGPTMFEFGWHRVLYWSEVVAGWILVSLFITGISGIMKKD